MSRRAAVRQLEDARDNFCGLGTRRVKVRLNKLAKTCAVAKALRIALEIEDVSTLGKKYAGSSWSSDSYEKKHQYIHELIFLFKEQNWAFGKHQSDSFATRHIIYFEIPTCEQISFHCSLDIAVPDYLKKWDGKTNSTLRKLEAAITEILRLQ